MHDDDLGTRCIDDEQTLGGKCDDFLEHFSTDRCHVKTVLGRF
jgi:hypothetical protein